MVQDAGGVEHELGDAQFNNEHPQYSRDAPRWIEDYEVHGIRFRNTQSFFFIFKL